MYEHCRSIRPLIGLTGGRLRLLSGATLLAPLALMPAAPLAWANLVITPTFDSSITGDPNAAAIEGTINTAINTYESAFTDPINVTIDFKEMTTGLGQSNTTLYKISYSDFYNALVADAKSGNDATALAHLPNGSAPGSTNPVTGSTTINVKTADLRALGFNGALFPPIGGFDGVIGLNTTITTPGSPGSSLQYSLLATTEHEIDEVLGLGSDLGQSNPFFSDPAAEDLFRYDSTGARSYTTNPTAKAFFSINGTTDLAQFDNQNDGGDWGDWQSNPLPPGVLPKVQDAFATPGANPALSVELVALDVIGYDPVQAVAAPEPGTLALLGTSLLGFAALRRRRQ
jgi:hypothetical protein